MTRIYDESQPVRVEQGLSGCRILAGALAFGLIAIALLAACGIIALVVAQNQGLLASMAPATPTFRPPAAGVTVSPVSTSGPTDTPTPSPTRTPTNTPTPRPTDTPTNTPPPTNTPLPTNTNVPTRIPPTQVPPTQPPAATAAPTQPPPPPAPAGTGLTADFSIENTNVAANERIWFNFNIRNPTGSPIPWGVIGVRVAETGQFQTSWSGLDDFDPNSSMTWRDGLNIGAAGTYNLNLMVCHVESSQCNSPGAPWEQLGATITVTVR